MLAVVEGAKSYIDDTFTFTADRMARSGPFSRCFRASGITGLAVNPLKCRFCVQEYSRHLVWAEGIGLFLTGLRVMSVRVCIVSLSR